MDVISQSNVSEGILYVACSGLDFSNFGDMLSGDLNADSVADAYYDLSPAGANYAQQIGWGWQELPIPVIAAVHGAAMEYGLATELSEDYCRPQPSLARAGHSSQTRQRCEANLQ
jgi:hypothetical protein